MTTVHILMPVCIGIWSVTAGIATGCFRRGFDWLSLEFIAGFLMGASVAIAAAVMIAGRG